MATMGPSTLKSMAYRACSRNLRNLHDLGDCPVHLIAPLLPKIDSAEQLRALEQNSPQILGHTRDAWVHLIQRDIPNPDSMIPIPNWKLDLFTLDTADRWHKVYFKLKKRAAKDAREKEKKLAAVMNGIAESRVQGSAPILDRKLVSTGKNRVAKATFNYNDVLYRSGGRATGKKTGPEKSFFERLGKTAGGRANARMRTPTHLLKRPVVGGAVHKAPVSLVEDARERERLRKEREELEREAELRRNQMGNVRGIGSRPTGQNSYDMIKDREARLRNLKNGNVQNGSPPTHSQEEIARLTKEFLESDEGNSSDDVVRDTSDDDLFGESKPPAPTNTTTTAKASAASPPMKPLAHAIKPPFTPPLVSKQPPVLGKRKAAAPLFRPNKR